MEIHIINSCTYKQETESEMKTQRLKKGKNSFSYLSTPVVDGIVGGVL